MGQTDPNATQKYPQDIHQYIKATARTVSTSYFFTERPQSKSCQFQGLHTKRNTNNGKHHQYA